MTTDLEKGTLLLKECDKKIPVIFKSEQILLLLLKV